MAFYIMNCYCNHSGTVAIAKFAISLKIHSLRFALGFCLLLLSLPHLCEAEKIRTVQAIKTNKAPAIDGKLDDNIWNHIQPISDFIQFEPQRGELSALKTETKIAYDKKALYVAFHCYDTEPTKISASITKRDGDLVSDDAVIIMLDTFNDNRTCYYFSTNSLGTQLDGKVADNGRSDDVNWDGNWYSAGKQTEDGWTVEIAIPFSILKFKEGENQIWGLNLGRYYPRTRERSYWIEPLEKENRVSQFGKLINLDLELGSKRYTIIPYALSQIQQGEKSEGKTGADIRYSLSSNLGAELTINPDFALVEADVEQINLTRFELNIPEKRPFFLEGSEHFQTRINQFYTRRIGDIPWGSKIVGKIKGWTIAGGTVQSDPSSTGAEGLEKGHNALYTVFRGRRDILGNSNVGLIYANRRYLGEDKGSIGLDTTLFFTRTLGMTAQFVKSYGPMKEGTWAWFLRPSYDSATGHFHVRYSHWGAGLMENMNDIAFISDDDRREVDSHISKTFWPKKSIFEEIDISSNYNQYWSQEGVLRSWDSDSYLNIKLTNRWGFDINYNEEFKLYEKEFRNRRTDLAINYDNRGGRSIKLSYGFGRNFDNDLKLVQGEIQYKITDAWNVTYGLTRLWLYPDINNKSTWIHLIRSYYYFNKDLFLKLFFQTNSVIDKKNAQALFVWRFLPPFGSLQIAYQRGTSQFGTKSDQGNTLFTKFSWVF
jgi:hypothetical protein